MSKKGKPTTTQASPIANNNSLYRRVFNILAGVIFVIMAILSLQSGINGDDKFQNDYSDKLVAFYTSLGADKSALNVPQGNMHYYGGFFDLVTGFSNKVLGFDKFDRGYHDVRHLFNALLGFLAIFYSSLIVRDLAGTRAAILTLLFLFFSPRFLGHSLMNPKDIPFAAGYIIALYFLLRVIKKMPKPDRYDMFGFVGGAALAIATRAGGLMLFGYLGLFLLLDFFNKKRDKNLKTTLLPYLKTASILAASAYVLALLFWPYGLVNPIAHPLEALSEFSKLGIRIRVLFAGESIMSDAEPWYYAPMWMWRTIPVFITIGFVGSFLFLKSFLKDKNILYLGLLWFATLFPLVFIMAKESLLHDAWRHLLFVYPPMVVAAVLFWLKCEQLLFDRKKMRYTLYAVLGLLMLEPAWFIARHSAFPYTYFQPLVGGLSANYGNYETDYWGLSVKQAVNWLEDEGIVSENMKDTVTIATSFLHPAQVYLNKYDKVKTIYTRFQGRYSKAWDYGIFPTRFINAAQLKQSFPPSKSAKTIYADGIPLSVIISEKNKYTYRAEKALMQRDTIYALDQFQKELTDFPDNEQAWLGMADAYYGANDYEKVLFCATEALKTAPQNVSGMYFKGLALAGLGRANEAKAIFQLATETDSEFYIAHFYLGVLAMEAGDLKTALNHAKTTLEIKPDFRNAQLLVAEIYNLAGQKEKGEEFLRKMGNFKKRPR